LIKQGDYAKAGVPMLPVVRGEHETKVQMLGYTIMLLPLTLLPWLAGELGLVYALAALIGGGRLLWYCLKLLKEKGVVHATAWGMYKYSLAYLFLLFIAMGLDRAFPVGRLTLTPPPEVFILGGESQQVPLEQVTGEHGDH
jgi:protoheme IX farnesyltransferase